jgi:hypothetical protein
MMLWISRRRAALGSLAALLAVVLVSGAVAFAQRKPDTKRKLNSSQQAEVQQLAAIVDSAMKGQAAPTDLTATWHNDFLKALEQKTYVPFTLTGDAQFGTVPTTMYLRVAPRGATGPAQPGTDKKDENAPQYAFEDANFFPARQAGTDPIRLSRAFTVPAGDYDVYVVLRDHPTSKGTPSRTGLIKQQITVPDFWSADLTTSSVMLADQIEQLTKPLSTEEQADRPYALGGTEILPSLDLSFTKKDELSVMFLIYNPGLGADKRPDLSVEYAFHTRAGDGEKYFNKTSPQVFNAQSLPPQFDFAAGHQLVAGQSVPLASFPEGEYRLEIKVVDKLSGKSVVRNVRFTVAS